MEFSKRNLVLVKAGLQYGLLNSTSEAESADFALLLVEVEGAILREENISPQQIELAKLKERAKERNRRHLAKEAMLVLLGHSDVYWINQKEQLIKESYSIADAFIASQLKL